MVHSWLTDRRIQRWTSIGLRKTLHVAAGDGADDDDGVAVVDDDDLVVGHKMALGRIEVVAWVVRTSELAHHIA